MHEVLRFGDCILDVGRGCLSKDGKPIDLRPKAFTLLHYLVSHPGRLLSKDELLEVVWPDVVVTEDSLVRCVHEARQALGDKDGLWIKTVPRRGYRFDMEVFVEASAGRSAETISPAMMLPEPETIWRRAAPQTSWTKIALATAAAVLLVSALVSQLIAEHPAGEPPRVAVLPFENLTGEPEQAYFSDGLTEDLITRLSYFPELAVIAGNSTASLKGSPLSTGQAGELLNAAFVLEGSVRRDRDRLRITAQLIEVESEEEIWARSYDRGVEEVFSVQDEVTQAIASVLASRVRAAHAVRGEVRAEGDLSAYDLVLQAREVALRTPSPESTREARELAERAIRIDANFAPAYVQLGRADYRAFVLEWDGQGALDRAAAAAEKAVSLDPTSAEAFELLGRIYLRRGDHQQAIATIEKALNLNPSMAEGYASLADALTFAGHAREAIPLLETAIQLDPFYAPQIDMYLGRAYYFERDFEKARLFLETCAARAPQFRPCFMYLAPVYAELGRTTDAHAAVGRLLAISPDFSIERSVQQHLPFSEEAMHYYLAGLRKAGVPE